MITKELEKTKKQLEEMRAQILRNIEGVSAEVKKHDHEAGYSQHQADQGTDNFDKTLTLEITSNEYEVLTQIERALEKIDEGTYGICEISGKKIPKKRLDAVPYALTTLEAQQELESGHIT